MNTAVIVGGLRIPFVKSFGKYSNKSNREMMTFVVEHLAKNFELTKEPLGEVSVGAVMKDPRDWNLAREVVMRSGLHPDTPAFDVQRACGTSLETTLLLANKISLGQIEVGIAGGTDSNSEVPILVNSKLGKRLINFQKAKTMSDKISLLMETKPADFVPIVPNANEPLTGMSMGEHCEKMAKEWSISRQAQDEFALRSQKNAISAYETGFYEDLVIPFHGVERDEFVRPDTSLAKMASLKPAFDKENGTLTAANSTPLTDGAAAVVIASEEYARKHNLPILAKFVDGQSAAVNYVKGEGLLMAPTIAVSNLLKRHDLGLQDFDKYEIHEAFAAQVLCTLSAWRSEDYNKNRLGRQTPLGDIDWDKINVKGGSVALGHPFGATGARLVATLGKELSEQKGRGLISVCTGGGMGIAAILESVPASQW